MNLKAEDVELNHLDYCNIQVVFEVMYSYIGFIPILFLYGRGVNCIKSGSISVLLSVKLCYEDTPDNTFPDLNLFNVFFAFLFK